MVIHSGLWKIRSKGATLILILDLLAFKSFLTMLWMLYEINSEKHNFAAGQQGSVGIILSVLALAFPVAGWLADIYFGRYKVLRFGLQLMWIGMLSMIVCFLLGYVLDNCSVCILVFYRIGGVINSMLVSVGFATYTVNSVQFGIDQMPDASSDELSAYIHWVVWVVSSAGVMAGLTYLIKYCMPIVTNIYAAGAIQLMVPMTMLSLALCCEFLLRGWLIIEPGCPNSLRMIYRVLKFAATHKYPIRRRAITYTEDERPSRIDFAKDKYGGPFTTEQVEDVKTFFRILLVAFSTAFAIASFIMLIISLQYRSRPPSQLTCSIVGKQIALSGAFPMFSVVLIPLYTFLVYPLLKKRMLSMLQRVTLAAVLTVILSLTVFVTDTIKNAQDPTIDCMFEGQSTAVTMVLNANIWIGLLCSLTIEIESVLYVVAILEFTCAQSPYSMRGLLMGMMYSVIFFTFVIASGIYTAWTTLKQDISPSCDFYYFLFQFLCAVVGLIVLCIVARWYKRRQREEEDDQRRIVEAIYDRMLYRQSLFHNNKKAETLVTKT